MDTEFQYIDFSLAQWKHRFDYSWFAVTLVFWVYWMKVVLQSLKSRLSLHSCGTENEVVPKDWILNLSTSISFLTMKASVWLQLVRRDFGMLDILNECSTNIPESRLSLHSCGTENEEVPQDWILNLCTSISVLHNESISLTSAGSPWLRYIEYYEWMQY